ncbi:MAG: DUF4125 family protein, partial [Lachnospiraceae bacterium]|nr:DUF4125 family protein [Lachnospiraceae bacterium]
MSQAIDIFERDGGKDFHYNAALVAMGDLMCRKNLYDMGAQYYQRGLDELEKHVGRNDNYSRIEDKLKYALRMAERVAVDPEVVGGHETNAAAESDEVAYDNAYSESETMAENQSEVADESLLINKGAGYEKDSYLYPKFEKSLLEQSRDFYERFGSQMIHEQFPEYESRIAVGMVGNGSDCFGFDDEISMDHDYGIGFCMWLTKEDYMAIGSELNDAYMKLLKDTGRYSNNYDRLIDRRGVFVNQAFYEEFLGENYSLEGGLFKYNDSQLAAATNGEVFRDDLGEFTAIRQRLLKYYADTEWRHKLIKSIHIFSQCGQSNYARMMCRGDYVSANICIQKAIEAAMDVVYLLAKTYAPYYKWKFKGIDRIIEEGKWQTVDKLHDLKKFLVELTDLGNQSKAWEGVIYNAGVVNYHDRKILLIDRIAQILLDEIKAQNIVKGVDLFLQNYESQILRDENSDSVSKIVKLEWEMFDKVKNEGGRADCQDDWNTFSIMRKSQYMAWSDALCESY